MKNAAKAMEIIENGIENLLTSRKWTQYLRMQYLFRNYSFSNTLLIWVQCPHATRIADLKTWKELGRYVKNEEEAIKIIAPLTHETKSEKESYSIQEFKEISVFDISQTDGKPLPSVVQSLGGETKLYERLKTICPVPVYEKENTNIITVVYKWAHSILHRETVAKEVNGELKKLEIESVSFIVCYALGIDTSYFSFGYLDRWERREKSIEQIKAARNRIQRAAQCILHTLQSNEAKGECA